MENENKSAEKTGCCGGGDKGGDKKEGCCKTKGCCRTFLMGGLGGGIVMFVYFLAAWRILPWHKAELLAFSHGSHETQVMYFLLCFVGAVLLTKVLKKGGSCPVFAAMIIGVLVGLFSYVPNMIFFRFPMHDALAGIVNDVIAFTLASLVISKCVLKKGGCKMGHCGTDDKKSGCCGGEGKDGDQKGCCH